MERHFIKSQVMTIKQQNQGAVNGHESTQEAMTAVESPF